MTKNSPKKNNNDEVSFRERFLLSLSLHLAQLSTSFKLTEALGVMRETVKQDTRGS